MSRMKDYFEFSQLLHWLSDEALTILLETESDSFKAQIIQNERDARRGDRGEARHVKD